MFVAGGITDQATKAAGFYNPLTNNFCHLPPLTPARSRHTVTGLTACGGQGQGTVNTCSTFNIELGQWEISYKDFPSHAGHVAWKNSKGILLMGGWGSSINYTATTQLMDGGGHQKGFDLVMESYFSCAIEDPDSRSIILTGGYGYKITSYMKEVLRYGENGFIEYLPNMTYPRDQHGCSGYYNEQRQLVNFYSFNLQA